MLCSIREQETLSFHLVDNLVNFDDVVVPRKQFGGRNINIRYNNRYKVQYILLNYSNFFLSSFVAHEFYGLIAKCNRAINRFLIHNSLQI